MLCCYSHHFISIIIVVSIRLLLLIIVVIFVQVVGHTKFGPDTGFGRMHLKFKGHDLFTGDDMKRMMMDNRNTPYEPNASIFRRWRETFKTFFGAMDGIKSTDVIEIRLAKAESGLVDISWAERREIGEKLVFEVQKQLLVAARSSDCDVPALIRRVKEATQFDEHLSRYKDDGQGLIKHTRKAYLIKLLHDELMRLEVEPDVLKWWADLPSQAATDTSTSISIEDDENIGTPCPPSPPSTATVPLPASAPQSSLSTASFQFLLDDICPALIATHGTNVEESRTTEEVEVMHMETAEQPTSLSKVFRDPDVLVQKLSGQKRKRIPSRKAQQ
tara:strand:- start:198 stop:1190 length:993 start_codon:yes stop_codon:yes gene_type:complete